MWTVTCPAFTVDWMDGQRLGDWSFVDRIMRDLDNIVPMPSWGAAMDYDPNDETACCYGAVAVAQMLGFEPQTVGDTPPEPDYTIGVPVRSVF